MRPLEAKRCQYIVVPLRRVPRPVLSWAMGGRLTFLGLAVTNCTPESSFILTGLNEKRTET